MRSCVLAFSSRVRSSWYFVDVAGFNVSARSWHCPRVNLLASTGRPGTPVVSICIPTHNREHLVGFAIESVIAQAFTSWELLIVDNASSDGTADVARRYALRDQRIQYFRFDNSVSAPENFNRCISLATTELVALLHDDDEYEPEFLSRAVPMLLGNPQVGFSYTACSVIDAEGSQLGIHQPFRHDHVWPARREFLSHVVSNHVFAPTVIVRAAAYAGVGGYRDDFPYLSDWDMWLRIELAGWSVCYIASPLARSRVHPDQLTARLQSRGEDIWNVYVFSHTMLRECRTRGIVLPEWTRRKVLVRSAVVQCDTTARALVHSAPNYLDKLALAMCAVRQLHSRTALAAFLCACARRIGGQLRSSVRGHRSRTADRPRCRTEAAPTRYGPGCRAQGGHPTGMLPTRITATHGNSATASMRSSHRKTRNSTTQVAGT